MQKKATFWVMTVGVLGALLGVAQPACAGLVVLDVKTGSGDPWTYDASAWSFLVESEGTSTFGVGPGWYSQDGGGIAEARVHLDAGSTDWTKYLGNPGSDPGVDVTLYEGVYYEDGTAVGSPTIIGWNMIIQTAGWEFVDATGLVGSGGGASDLMNGDGGSGIRGGDATIYDFAFDSAEPQGEGAHIRLAVDLRWVGGGTPPSDVLVLQTACLSGSALPCTASGGSTPPTPSTPIPATPALLGIGLVGMRMRRRRSS